MLDQNYSGVRPDASHNQQPAGNWQQFNCCNHYSAVENQVRFVPVVIFSAAFLFCCDLHQ